MDKPAQSRLRALKGLGFLLIAWLAVVILFSIQLNIISPSSSLKWELAANFLQFRT